MSSRTSLGFEHKLPVPAGPVGNCAHIVLFGVLAFLLARAFDREGASAGLVTRAGRAAFVLATLYGLSDEVHQFFTPGRTCSVYDVVLDALGAAAGLIAPWPRGPGRPAGWLAAFSILALAVGVAIATGLTRPPPDRLIEDALRALGFAGR